jgi:hypothetical protein
MLRTVPAGHQSHGGMLGQITQSCQALQKAIILPQGIDGHPFGKRLRGKFEVGEKHHFFLS